MKTRDLRDRAVALHRSGRLGEAEQLYLDVLAGAPRDFTARHLLGVVRAQQGRREEALAGFDRALAVKPGWPQALNNRGTVLNRWAVSTMRWPTMTRRWQRGPRPRR